MESLENNVNQGGWDLKFHKGMSYFLSCGAGAIFVETAQAAYEGKTLYATLMGVVGIGGAVTSVLAYASSIPENKADKI